MNILYCQLAARKNVIFVRYPESWCCVFVSICTFISHKRQSNVSNVQQLAPEGVRHGWCELIIGLAALYSPK